MSQGRRTQELEQNRDYQRVEKAIAFLIENRIQQPDLSSLSAAVGVSEYHLQRIFSRWAGVSPKRFLQFLTKEHAKKLLRKTSVAEAALASGLSGASRLHDLIISCEAMTPGEYQRRGAELLIHYGWHVSPFGECLIAVTDRGICNLFFLNDVSEREMLQQEFLAQWSRATLVYDEVLTQPWVAAIFPKKMADKKPLHLLLKGTNFQLKVWEALMSIPPGQLLAYNDVAERIGKDSAVRAVSTAIAKNRISYLIPCHRVIRKSGDFNQYRWGLERKQAMIAWESCQIDGVRWSK